MTTTEAPERKYALTKLAAGDYLLPSNDAATVWRLSTYTDGPSMGLDSLKRDREFWGVWRFIGRPVTNGLMTGEEVEDWNQWEQFDSLLDSRAAAIRSAMKAGAA